MDSMQTVLIVIHLMVVLALIGVVLIQRSEGGGLGIGGGGGGGSGGGFFTARGTANVLTRATAILALIFFITSLSLTIVAGLGRAPRSILPPAQQNQGGPQVPQSGGSILDQLRQQAPQGAGAPQGGAAAPATPAAPAAPSGPQVPQSK